MAKAEKPTELVLIDPKEYGLENDKAALIDVSFNNKQTELAAFNQQYSELITSELSPQLSKSAYDLRKKLVKVRTGIAEIHKVEKAFYLSGGRYVDALKNKLTLAVEQMEEKLSEIETHYEKIEAKRIADLKEARLLELEKYQVDTEFVSLDKMPDDVYAKFLDNAKTAFEAKKIEAQRIEKERIEAEKKAEADRIEAARVEAERIETQRIENERLKKEAEAKELELKREREKAEAEAKKKQAEIDAANAEADKSRLEAKRLKDLEDERIEAQKQKAIDDQLAKDAAAKALLLAPDKEKIRIMHDAIKNFHFPECKSKEAKAIVSEIQYGFEIIRKGLIEQSKKLV